MRQKRLRRQQEVAVGVAAEEEEDEEEVVVEDSDRNVMCGSDCVSMTRLDGLKIGRAVKK